MKKNKRRIQVPDTFFFLFMQPFKSKYISSVEASLIVYSIMSLIKIHWDIKWFNDQYGFRNEVRNGVIDLLSRTGQPEFLPFLKCHNTLYTPRATNISGTKVFLNTEANTCFIGMPTLAAMTLIRVVVAKRRLLANRFSQSISLIPAECNCQDITFGYHIGW